MNPVNTPIYCLFGKISSPFLILSRAWVTNFFFIRSVVPLEMVIGSNACGSPRTAYWYESIWFSTVPIYFNFCSTALCGSSKTFLIHFLGCINIILVLCEVVPPVKSSSLKSSLPIITVPAFPLAVSAGHTGCLSNSFNAHHLCKNNTLWYGTPMPKSEAAFTTSLLLLNPCNSKE